MTDRVRVALTLEQCWHGVPGGTAVSVLHLLDALARDQPDIELVGVAGRHRRPAPAPFTPPIDVRQLPLPGSLMYRTWHAFGWPDVEHATGPVDVTHATTIAVAATRAPLVVTIHDLAFLHEPEFFTRRGLRFFDRGLRAALRRAAVVVCPSEASAADCRRVGFGDDRVRVIPWGVDPVEVTPVDRRRVRSRHGLDRPFVLFVGTIEPRKNLSRVVQAFAELDRDDLDLAIAGPAGWKEDLDAIVASTPVVPKRLGFVDQADLAALYAEASVLCTPSIREGFGLPVLEAMTQATPAVTSAGTSTAEIVGDAGVLVDPLDVHAIADGLRRALADPDLGSAAAARAAQFTSARSAERHAELYRELAG